MTYSRLASKTFGLLLGCLWLLAGMCQPAEARHRCYINKHSVSTTSVVAAGITVLRGRASWYGKEFQGRRTTSGERFNRFKFTCAHKTLPFGTRLRVTNIKTGKAVVVRVADRGPFRHQRILDLAEVAARPLGIVDHGSATVIAEVVAPTTPLGPTASPDNLAALTAADPDPAAAFATYAAPLADSLALAATTPAPAADSVALLAATVGTLALAAKSTSRFVVQAGTFAEPQNALVMQARIAALDQQLPVSIATEVVDGRPFSRVVIGQLDSWLAAETVRRNLQLWGIAGLVRQLPAEQAGLTAALTAVPTQAMPLAAAAPK